MIKWSSAAALYNFSILAQHIDKFKMSKFAERTHVITPRVMQKCVSLGSASEIWIYELQINTS